jgi:hypothetical protein
MSELWIRHSGIVTREILSPFVYFAGGRPPALSRSDEVADAYWVGLDHLWAPANATTFDYERPTGRVTLPGIQYDGRVIWGLTHMMLSSFARLVGTPLPASAGAASDAPT